jgi:hypothetical protein
MMRLPRSPSLRSVCAAFSIALGLVALNAPPVFAQSDADRATARSLGVDGQQALESRDYKAAEDRFRRADSLVHAPTLMLGLARALAGQGKYVEAQEAYNRIIREGLPPSAPEVFRRALADAKREVDGVSPKIGGATISVHAAGGADVPNAKVMLDGAPVSNASLGVRRSIDPGSHLLQVSADGFKPAELRFNVTEGATVDAPVTLEAEPNAQPPATVAATSAPGATAGAEEPSPSNGGNKVRAILPWVAFGVGAAGLATGGIAGIVAMGKHSDIAKQCPDPNACTYAGAHGDISGYHSVATVSTVGFIVGGVGVAAGVVLFLTRPKGESGPSAAATPTALRVIPTVGLGSIGAIGTF